MGKLSGHGSFGNQSADYLDGQPLNIGYINLSILIPTQDSISLRCKPAILDRNGTQALPAESPISAPSLGASSIHGEAYEYLRNRIFNAKKKKLKIEHNSRDPP